MYQSATVVYWMKYAPNKVIIPGSVDIDLTNICNQDCFYCNSAEFRSASPGGPVYTQYIDLLDKLSTWRAHSPNSVGSLQTITYPGGGEPTLLKGYENVIEHTLDLEFLTSITTNGFKLDRLVDAVPHHKLRKMGWIGIDIDAGEPELYEEIRRTVNGKTIFHQVKENATALVDIGVNVDFKVLLGKLNSNEQAIRNTFKFAKEVGVRLLYFRPMYLNGEVFPITEETKILIDQLSQEYAQPAKYNLTRYRERNYSRCHQMFQFPVFCADGHVYSCCENKGNPHFRIGTWTDGDFRDQWLDKRHWAVYNNINTHLCHQCRSNGDNIEIQNILDNPELIEKLYL